MILLTAAEVSFAYYTYAVHFSFTITPGDPWITLETYTTYRDIGYIVMKPNHQWTMTT